MTITPNTNSVKPVKMQANGVPCLAFRVWRGGRKRRGAIHYEEEAHKHLPHVVKFSGGRSSGMLLLILLENGLLDATRGDVILFTNTSAEHPATYDFVRKMKRVTESYGIPFLIAQLQTYETVFDGLWTRRLSYKLVNSNPASNQNPNGYEHRGEVFLETIAWAGMLPTVHTRICTTNMKMHVTREFLSDWFGGNSEIPRQGHRGNVSLVDQKALYNAHLRNGGGMTLDEFANKWNLLCSRPFFRPNQAFSDFTKLTIRPKLNKMHRGCVYGGRCNLFGTAPAPFLTLLGFRFGEDARYNRMIERNRGGQTPGHDTHPPGEYSYAPLFNLSIDGQQVKDFWKMQNRSIRPHLPEEFNLSNCVYCFLKGPKTISEIHRLKNKFERNLPKGLLSECRKRNTPSSLEWWAQTEEQFRRNAKKRSSDGSVRSKFGMFGLNSTSYRSIKQNGTKIKPSDIKEPIMLESISPNCECTD